MRSLSCLPPAPRDYNGDCKCVKINGGELFWFISCPPSYIWKEPSGQKRGREREGWGAAYATKINHAEQSSQRLAKHEVSDRLGRGLQLSPG